MTIDSAFLLRGLAIGFAIAAPVGPIGVLCIRRTLADGWRSGLLTGLGAATADAIYGCVAGFGLTFVAAFLVNQRLWLGLVGGIFLCYLGVRTFFTRPSTNLNKTGDKGAAGNYFSTLLLTLTNPMTILSFAAIFAGLGLGSAAGDYWDAAVLVLGVFLGSASWWLLLSGITSLLRSKITSGGLNWVNRISGVIIFAFGVVALVGSGLV